MTRMPEPGCTNQSSDFERELCELHPASFRWALSCVRDRFEADDVLQTVYLKIFDGRARFDGRSSLKTWLFSVIRLTAAERRRGWWSRLMARTDRNLPLDLADTGDDPHSAAVRSENVSRLLAALAGLSPKQRAILKLVFSHDMTVEEASVALGVSVGTGRVHYHRGKKRLLEELRKQGIS
jgi:RNA polymerase sigma factor (sigma-70 family)